ncbi:MAG: LLM class flavin-dependent oxidoreductase [Microbacterium sp.]
MKFSVLVPHVNYSASPDAIRDVAQAAEGLGYAGLAVADQIHYGGWYIASGSTIPVEGGDRRDIYEAFETLAYLAAITERVELMPTVVVVPVREPVLAAKQLATIDVLSKGRLAVGVGVGRPWTVSKDAALVNETHRAHAAAQYDLFRMPKHRGNLMDECLDAWVEIWTQELASYHGEYVDFTDVPIFPKPVQKPHPRFFVGGRADAAINRTARLGGVWLPSQPNPYEYEQKLPLLRERFEAHGRPAPTETGINLFASFSPDGDDAVNLVQDAVGKNFQTPEEMRLRTIAGDKQFWIDRLNQWAQIGVTYVDLKPIYRDLSHLMEQLEFIATEIMPEVAPSAPIGRAE